jgi:hypothetical protein
LTAGKGKEKWEWREEQNHWGKEGRRAGRRYKSRHWLERRKKGKNWAKLKSKSAFVYLKGHVARKSYVGFIMATDFDRSERKSFVL